MIDLEGKRVGRLTVKHPKGRSKFGSVLWECECSCGNVTVIDGQFLRSGLTKSCGCLKKEKASINGKKVTHGQSYHPLFKIWSGMKRRCYNKRYAKYHNYGGRGIKMSKSWYNSFDTFCRDMGERPSPKHSIERKNNDAGYCKSNCKWATRTEQNNNTRQNIILTFEGVSKTIAQWGKELGIKSGTLYWRYHKGLSVENILGKSKSTTN